MKDIVRKKSVNDLLKQAVQPRDKFSDREVKAGKRDMEVLRERLAKEKDMDCEDYYDSVAMILKGNTAGLTKAVRLLIISLKYFFTLKDKDANTSRLEEYLRDDFRSVERRLKNIKQEDALKKIKTKASMIKHSSVKNETAERRAVLSIIKHAYFAIKND